MIKFSDIHSQLLYNLHQNKIELERSLGKSPSIAFNQINQISAFIGSRFHVSLQLHFPDSSKIKDVSSYGTENIGIVIDKFRRTFPIPRESIKEIAKTMLGDVRAEDAYMYEGKEGVKIIGEIGRIEILPGSVHLWCKIDDNVTKFTDWLMEEVYFRKSST